MFSIHLFMNHKYICKFIYCKLLYCERPKSFTICFFLCFLEAKTSYLYLRKRIETVDESSFAHFLPVHSFSSLRMGSGGSTAGNYVQKRSVQLKEGDKLPVVKFKARVKEIGNGKPADSYVWRDISTEDLFKGKRVVLFGVPGGNVF